MTPEEIIALARSEKNHNFHSHTQYCDGRATMEEMSSAAAEQGMKLWGISPHSPICVESPCNMTKEQVEPFLNGADILKNQHEGKMKVFTAMEVDFISRDFGPHIDYFQNLPLDYRIGSVHFVPTQEGVPVDCDGSADRFLRYLHEIYHNDLRYVVEKYFEHVLTMIELGGFEILGHFDKIAGNAYAADPEIENNSWYEAFIDDVIRQASYKGLAIEINTKALADRNRFYPSQKWWQKMKDAGIEPIFNSDAHYPEKIRSGREEAMEIFYENTRKN